MVGGCYYTHLFHIKSVKSKIKFVKSKTNLNKNRSS